MTQIIEYAKIRDVILIYHFEFERDDRISIGDHFSCSLNKYMCLNDWLTISLKLGDCVEACLRASSTELSPKSEDIQFPNLNVALNVNWIKMDPIYTRLVDISATETVHPFVMKLNVTPLSNTNGFASSEATQSTPAQTNGADVVPVDMRSTIATTRHNLKEAIVVIEKLNIDDYMSPSKPNGNRTNVIETCSSMRHSNKRQFSRIEDESPLKESAHVEIGGSSTPLLRKMSKRLTKLEKGGPRISVIRRRSRNINPAFLATPKIKNRLVRKAQPSSLREKFQLQSTKKKIRAVQKDAKQRIGRNKVASKVLPTRAKRTEIASSANSTDFFEEIPPTKKSKNSKRTPSSPVATATAPALAPAPAATPVPASAPAPASSRDANEILDLKSITADYLKHSFQQNFAQLKKLFEDYESQEDEEVIKAADYDHVDIISLLQSDHIQIMLDMLYSHFVKEEVHNGISFTNLFFELMVPEWSLAIFMEKYSMDRKKAVEKIHQQTLINPVDDSQSLLFITQNSLDEDV